MFLEAGCLRASFSSRAPSNLVLRIGDQGGLQPVPPISGLFHLGDSRRRRTHVRPTATAGKLYQPWRLLQSHTKTLEKGRSNSNPSNTSMNHQAAKYTPYERSQGRSASQKPPTTSKGSTLVMRPPKHFRASMHLPITSHNPAT